MSAATRVALGASIGIALTATALTPSAAQTSGRTSSRTSASPAAAPAVCRGGFRDDFTGAKLDRARWPTVVRETPAMRLADGNLIIPTSQTDIIWPDDPKLTENIVLRELPPGPFTATTKLTLEARHGYQQAGLIVYADDDNYIKLVFFASGDNDPAVHAPWLVPGGFIRSPSRQRPRGSRTVGWARNPRDSSSTRRTVTCLSKSCAIHDRRSSVVEETSGARTQSMR